MRISDWSSDVCSSDLASAADLEAAQVAIVGEVARTYFDLRGLQERLRVARENADNQRETLRLVDARLDAGRGTGFDTARARAQLETTSARIPALEAQVAFDMHRLAVLVGKTPDALVAELTPTRALPELPGSEERRGGQESGRPCRSRWSPE